MKEVDMKNSRLDIRLIPETIKILLKISSEKLINKFTIKDLLAILNMTSSVYFNVKEISFDFSALIHLIAIEMLEKSTQPEHYEIWLEFVAHPHLKLYFTPILKTLSRGSFDIATRSCLEIKDDDIFSIFDCIHNNQPGEWPKLHLMFDTWISI